MPIKGVIYDMDGAVLDTLAARGDPPPKLADRAFTCGYEAAAALFELIGVN